MVLLGFRPRFRSAVVGRPWPICTPWASDEDQDDGVLQRISQRLRWRAQIKRYPDLTGSPRPLECACTPGYARGSGEDTVHALSTMHVLQIHRRQAKSSHQEIDANRA